MGWEPYDAEVHGTSTRALFERVAADGLPVLTEFKEARVDDPSAATGMVFTRDGRILAYVQAARHPTGPSGRSHAAIEIVADAGFPLDDAVRTARLAVPSGERHVVWAWRDDLAGALEAAGYEETRAVHRLERPLPIDEAAAFPEGVMVTTFAVGRDEAAWIETNNLAFAGHPENGAVDMAELHMRTGRDWFDPEGIIMAWDGDGLAGSCWTKLHGDGIGEIYIVGVHPRARGIGLGRALVLAGLHDLHDRQGAREGMLYVDDANVAAVWLYEELGFERVFTNRMYEPVGQPKR